eukprot:505958-Pleurochrysis_carterae.AAC.3
MPVDDSDAHRRFERVRGQSKRRGLSFGCAGEDTLHARRRCWLRRVMEGGWRVSIHDVAVQREKESEERSQKRHGTIARSSGKVPAVRSLRPDSEFSWARRYDQQQQDGKEQRRQTGEWSAAEGVPKLGRTVVPELLGTDRNDGP